MMWRWVFALVFMLGSAMAGTRSGQGGASGTAEMRAGVGLPAHGHDISHEGLWAVVHVADGYELYAESAAINAASRLAWSKGYFDVETTSARSCENGMCSGRAVAVTAKCTAEHPALDQ